MCRKRMARPGFTLLELLVVLVIVGLVSVLAIPAVIHSYRERSIQSAAQLVHAAISAARDEAIGSGSPRGIRFLPDPTLPDACSRLVPLATAPDYSDGLLASTDIANLPPAFVLPYPCLMVEGAVYRPDGQTSPPVNWAHNVRVGDQIRIGDSGPWMTVVGPTDPANPTVEQFVTPTQILDRQDGHGRIDYLWIVNGKDDDNNGFIDDGFDGVDNNVNGVIDEADEWEVEHWQRPVPIVASPYTIRRRPVPASGVRGMELPAGIVLDLTTWATTRERSRVMVNPTTGTVSLIFHPDGTVKFDLPYSTPSSVKLDSGLLHLWLAERSDVVLPGPFVADKAPTLPIPPALSGRSMLVTIQSRTGRVSSLDAGPFDPVYDPEHGHYGTDTPFMAAKSGAE